jgi:glycosyltransferase involved in cell wall biosynthesis
MKLSILICTIPSRTSQLNTLLKVLLKTLYPDVEVLYLGDNKKRTVGAKRNDLLKLAKGDYIVFVDDDDKIVEDYVYCLLKGIESDADIICFDVECSVNGSPFKKVIYDAKFPRDSNLPDRYERMPNHLMCVKREIALNAMFPDKSFGEDQEYARRIKRQIKTQARINKTLYFYVFSNKTSETQ